MKIIFTKILSVFCVFTILITAFFCFNVSAVESTGNYAFDAFIENPLYRDGVSWGNNHSSNHFPNLAWGCGAYAYDFAFECYGYNPNSGIPFYDANEIKAGDVIIVGNRGDGSGHWFVVLKRSGKNLYTAEGNASGKVRIGWNWQISGSNSFNWRNHNGNFIAESRKFSTGYHQLGDKLKTVSKSLTVIKSTAPIREAPTKYANKAYSIAADTKLNAIGEYTNSYGNIWYLLDDGNWIYSKNVSPTPVVSITYNTSSSSSSQAKTSSSKAAGSSSGGNSIVKKPEPIFVQQNSSHTIQGPTPIKEGYTFIGYSTEPNATTVEYHIGDKITADDNIQLYPVFKMTSTTMKIDSYNVTLDVSNNNNTTTLSVKCKGELAKSDSFSVTSDNSSVATASISEKKYHNYFLWDSYTCDLNIDGKSGGTANITLALKNSNGKTLITRSVFVSIDESYNVKFYSDGALVKTQTKTYGNTLVLSNYIPIKNNYYFMGWATDSSTTVVYGPGDSYKENKALDLYAVWDEAVRIDAPIWDDVTKTLTLTGKGDMPCYSSGKAPWAEYATKAAHLVISSGIASIGSNAFANFTSLQDVVLYDGIIKIGNYAFENCSKLTSINIPYSLKGIGNRAFKNCSSLSKINLLGEDVPSAKSRNSLRNLTSENTVNADNELTIGTYAFECCNSLTSVFLPDNVTELGDGAFSNCRNLKNVEISDGMTEIKNNTFFNCNNLEEIEIPNNIKEIGDYAFSGCELAETIAIAEGVKTIGNQAFSGCSLVEEVIIPQSVENAGAGIFTNCSALTDVKLYDNMTEIPDAMFSGCSALTEVEIPKNCEEIGEGAFMECSSLETIILPKGITAINDSTFWGCSSLNSIETLSVITSYGDYAFCECSDLTEIPFDEGLTTLGVCSFAYCSALEKAYFPQSLTEIGDYAFLNCGSLSNVEFLDSDLSIGEYAFSGCSAIESVYLPEELTSLGNNAFEGCSLADIYCFSTASVYKQVVDSYSNVISVIPVKRISLDNESVTVNPGETVRLSAVFFPLNATDMDVTWMSNCESVATVDKSGVVTAISGGNATIYVTSNDGNFEAACEVTVNVPVEGIQFTEKTLSGTVGSYVNVYYTFVPDNPSNIENTLTSSDTDIADFNDEGLLEIKAEGTVTITVKSDDGNFTDICNVVCSKAEENNESDDIEIPTDIDKVIISVPDDKTIKYKFRAKMTATAKNLPDGYYVQWFDGNKTVGDKGTSATYTSSVLISTSYTFTAKIVDEKGKIVSSDNQDESVNITVKRDFSQKSSHSSKDYLVVTL